MAALFLLVLLLVEGWGMEPAAAGIVVTAMPLAAIASARFAPRSVGLGMRTASGVVLVAGGLLTLALLPRAGWRDGQVRRIVRMAALSSGSSGLNSIGLLALLVAAGQIPGGAVAFQIASNLFNLPIALCARPVASAQLPLLSRSFARSAG